MVFVFLLDSLYVRVHRNGDFLERTPLWKMESFFVLNTTLEFDLNQWGRVGFGLIMSDFSSSDMGGFIAVVVDVGCSSSEDVHGCWERRFRLRFDATLFATVGLVVT